jgi:putative ABC transport system permease protein
MNTLFLAWQYLKYHRLRTAVLIAAITLVIYLPVALHVVVEQSSAQLSERAQATPLVLGQAGSPVELVLNALYFGAAKNPPLDYSAVQQIDQSGLALGIPLHTRFRSHGFPIVGTTVQYLSFRQLELQQGRRFALPGEAVIGAKVARQLHLNTGDTLVSSPETVFDLAGVYPLKMTVVGILKPTLSPDDEAILVDIKTAWIIQGLGHGHQDLSAPDARKAVLKREGKTIVANASVVQYNEITAQNIASFHFHGDLSAYPISAVLPVTKSDKNRTLLLGRFADRRDQVQLIEPRKIVAELIDTLLQIEHFVRFAIMLVAVATALVIILVFMLSHRLRHGEFRTLSRIGSSPGQLLLLQVTEFGMVLCLSLVLVALLTYLTRNWGVALVQAQVF